MKKISICFIAPHAYPLLAKTAHHFAGGSEVQQILIAQELRKHNLTISFIVANYGAKSVEYVDDIKILKSPANYRGGKLSYITTLCALLFSLSAADSDIYFLRSPSYLLGIVGLFCKIRKKKLIFSCAIDYECDKEHLGNMVSYVSKIFYFIGLRLTHVIFAQTTQQKNQFKKNFGLEAVVIKNLFSCDQCVSKKIKPPIVLWVGTASEWKRPQLFLDLAKELPAVHFRMVIAPGLNRKFDEMIRRKAKDIVNLEYLGFIPYHRVAEQYAQASILVNTSRWEGFPNTFLQAWAYKTPVISLEVDPDEIICRNRLGCHSKTFDQMVEDVKVLLNDYNMRMKMGNNGEKYVEIAHNVVKIGKQIADIIGKLKWCK